MVEKGRSGKEESPGGSGMNWDMAGMVATFLLMFLVFLGQALSF